MSFFIQFILVWGALSLIGFIVFYILFGPATIRFIRSEFVPLWRAWWRERQAKAYRAKVKRAFGEKPAPRWPFCDCLLNRILLLVAMLTVLLISLIVTAP